MSVIPVATFFRLVDSVANVIGRAYQTARSRLVAAPSPVLRMIVQRDHVISELELLRRELEILRNQRAKLPPHRRPDYQPSERLAILQLRRLRGWSIRKTADHFVLHANTLQTWIKAVEGSGRMSLLKGVIVWNRIDDMVRWTAHELRRLCPEPEFGSRAIARHIIRAGAQISRSTVQRVLREPVPSRPKRKCSVALLAPENVEPYHLLRPLERSRVWHMDLTELRIFWCKFTMMAILDGFSRKLLCLRVYRASPNTRQAVNQVLATVRRYGKPRFVITDHGPQFRSQFCMCMLKIGVEVVQGRVRAPYLNGKIERLFRSFRLWWRWVITRPSTNGIQRHLENFRHWYNDLRPHSALCGITPNEAWEGRSIPHPTSFRARDAVNCNINVQRLRCRGDPWLPVIEITVRRAA